MIQRLSEILFFFFGCSPRNTDTWTTSCLRTTPLPTASWTSGGRPAVSGWATCTAGSPSTKTSRWASGPRLPPSTSLHRWTACFPPDPDYFLSSAAGTAVQPVVVGNLLLPALLQNATQNSLELVDDPKAAAVDEIAAKLGLCKVCIGFLVPFLHLTLILQRLTPCLWRSGGLDLFRPAVRRHEDRNCPLHQEQGGDVAPPSSSASSHWTCYFLSCSPLPLVAVRIPTTWAQKSASQPAISRTFIQTRADSLGTAILAPNLWLYWRLVGFVLLLGGGHFQFSIFFVVPNLMV